MNDHIQFAPNGGAAVRSAMTGTSVVLFAGAAGAAALAVWGGSVLSDLVVAGVAWLLSGALTAISFAVAAAVNLRTRAAVTHDSIAEPTVQQGIVVNGAFVKVCSAALTVVVICAVAVTLLRGLDDGLLALGAAPLLAFTTAVLRSQVRFRRTWLNLPRL